jgi:YHS domain-containing protein
VKLFGFVATNSVLKEIIMNRRNILASFAFVGATLALGNISLAASPAIDTGILPGVALGGYDAVSYFQGGPIAGDPAKAITWQGAKWYFSTDDNLAAFKAAPEKFAPQYGGYCAFAVAKGSTAKGDPKVFSIVDGKNYVNLSTSVQSLWKKDIPGNISAADANWPGLHN